MLTDLGWLPAAPIDFRSRVETLRKAVSGPAMSDLTEQAVALATAALDENQLHMLRRLSREIARSEQVISGSQVLRVGLTGDGPLSLLAPVIAGSALRHGLVLEIVEGRYGGAVQDAVDPSSPLRAAKLDLAVVATDARLIGLDHAAASATDAAEKVEEAFRRLRLIVDNLRHSVSTIFVQTLPVRLEPLFGSFDRVAPGSSFAMVEALNQRLAGWAGAHGIILIDIARLAASVGLEHWHDPRHWHAAKFSFSPIMLPVYGDVVARTIAASRGKTKRCLVLDLDNTLWGGVVGDDGPSGITIGQGSAVGEAHLAIQRMAMELRERGVVLAVCSKNDDAVARLPFRDHPDMLLREDHIAVFQANWTDKAANLRAIAKQLNIGVDALVFLDDNPAERLQVRQALPLVGVPELPPDPAYYPRMLAAAGYFDAVTFSREDRERAAYYQANAQRAVVLAESTDLGAYLASLDMVCTIGPVDGRSRARAAQLINKSNQFNLTTRRYSEADVAAIQTDPTRHIIQVRLADRFGDNGVICVIIADKGAADWEIDTWLMSCRVLGRRVEEACLAHLVAAARRAGASGLRGRYVPSAKNQIVLDHYAKLGFSQLDSLPDGGTIWRLDLHEYADVALEMVVDDQVLARVDALA